jgi:hypothetical protein
MFSPGRNSPMARRARQYRMPGLQRRVHVDLGIASGVAMASRSDVALRGHRSEAHSEPATATSRVAPRSAVRALAAEIGVEL